MTRLTGLGGMGLSQPGVDRGRAKATLHAALDAGVRLLDTADVYGPTADAIGHGERLIAEVLEARGAKEAVVVATKGGLVRQGARWRPDGRAQHLRAACEASRGRLGVEAIDVYFLHAPDPAVPFATSVRALAALKKAGHVRSVGLSNVTVEQIEAAQAHVEVGWVQVELGVLSPGHFESGVAEHCRAEGIRLIAHRPLGGPKGISRLRRDPCLTAVAERLGARPEDVALAWLYDLHPELVAIPGATRPDTARRAAVPLRLDLEARSRLDASFPHGRMLRVPRAERDPGPTARGDVVIVMGPPGAGKSTRAQDFVARGYTRLNRDERGGRLADLVAPLSQSLDAGRREVVLDNTYPTRASRNRVIEASWRSGAPVRCVWVDTSIEDAQLNAVDRMLARHGRLLDADAISALPSPSPETFLPTAQFRFRDRFEAPSPVEGFTEVERARFERRPGSGRPALIVDADRFLWSAELDPIDDVAEPLRALARRGDRWIGAIAWRPEIGAGRRPPEDLAAAVRRLRDHLGLELQVEVCPHPPGPPRCWCRRPLPGLGALLRYRHRLDLGRSLFLAEGAVNRTFADRLGLTLIEPGGLTELAARSAPGGT